MLKVIIELITKNLINYIILYFYQNKASKRVVFNRSYKRDQWNNLYVSWRGIQSVDAEVKYTMKDLNTVELMKKK